MQVIKLFSECRNLLFRQPIMVGWNNKGKIVIFFFILKILFFGIRILKLDCRNLHSRSKNNFQLILGKELWQEKKHTHSCLI